MKILQKVVCLLILFWVVPSFAVVYTPLILPDGKLFLFNGTYTSMNQFFVAYQGNSNKLVLKTVSTNGISQLNANADWINAGMPATTLYKGYARIGNGQCVDFIRKTTGNTSTWVRGDHVTEFWDPNVLVGKVIATFNTSGSYDNGHVAVVISAWKRAGSNTVTDAWVVDQNYVPSYSDFLTNGGSIAKHAINIDGSSHTARLQDYYTVKY